MPNSIDNLKPFLVASMSRVIRTTAFAMNLFDRDPSSDAAALNQTVNLNATTPGAAYDITPGATPPSLVDSAPTLETLTLNKFKGARFHLTGEDLKALASNGDNFRLSHVDQKIADVFTAAANDGFAHLNTVAGYALGAQGTDPFASNPNILMDCWERLATALAPDSDRLGVLSTADYAATGKLTQFQKLNEAPNGVDFATGRIGMLANFNIGYDQAIGSHTKGTGSGYLVNNGAGYNVGDTAIAVDTGTGTILPGEVLYFGADTANKYVVRSFAGGIVTLNAGLRVAVVDNAAITIQASHRVAGIFASRSALLASLRPPEEAPGGDASDDVAIIRDPVSGIAMRVAGYGGYHARQYEVSMIYGFGVRRRAHIVKLIA